MEIQIKKSTLSLIWLACIAITLFCLTGIAAIMGWIPASTRHHHEVMIDVGVEKHQDSGCVRQCEERQSSGLSDENSNISSFNGGVVKASLVRQNAAN